MTVYLVRHAKAVRRADWAGTDRLRPLTAGGHRQAFRLVEHLDDVALARVIASPLLRCRQTVEPLAARRGLALESDPRLTEGGSIDGARELLAELGEASAVLCSHGDLIPRLLDRLHEEGLVIDDELQCEKGSIWVLEEPGFARARYLPAPTRGADPLPDFGTREIVEAADEDPADRKFRTAVLDLGSTSFHLLVADATSGGEIRRVERERRMLRLGALIAPGRRVPDEVCELAVKTARELRRTARKAKVELWLPVATAALREAENGSELARRIGEAFGASVRILSGQEEARLIFAGFRHRVAVGGGPTLGVDLGGGSLELAIGDDDDVHWETTLPLGVVRLHSELVRDDPMTRGEVEAIRDRVRELLAPHRQEVLRRQPELAVTTGGTVGALARRAATRRTSWPLRSVSQLFVPFQELSELTRELIESTHEERSTTPGIPRQRADLLPTGAVVLETLCDELGLDGFTVSDWGLREGVILEALGLALAGRRIARAEPAP
jgi:broad specificity phosphatase PhoE